MKMKMELSTEEALKAVEAMREVALRHGWDADELDECGVLEEYAAVMDATFAAVGIELCVNPSLGKEEEDEEDEEQEEVDDFGVPTDYWSEFDEEEEEEEEEVETPSENPILPHVYEYKGKKVINESVANEILDALDESIAKQCGELPKEVRLQIALQVWMKIGEECGIEAIRKGA